MRTFTSNRIDRTKSKVKGTLLLLAPSPEAAEAHHGRHVRILERQFLLLVLLLLLGLPLRLLLLSLSSLFVVLQKERRGKGGGEGGMGDKLN